MKGPTESRSVFAKVLAAAIATGGCGSPERIIDPRVEAPKVEEPLAIEAINEDGVVDATIDGMRDHFHWECASCQKDVMEIIRAMQKTESQIAAAATCIATTDPATQACGIIHVLDTVDGEQIDKCDASSADVASLAQCIVAKIYRKPTYSSKDDEFLATNGYKCKQKSTSRIVEYLNGECNQTRRENRDNLRKLSAVAEKLMHHSSKPMKPKGVPKTKAKQQNRPN